MAVGDTLITVIGNLTKDPDLKFLGDGQAVLNFTVASTPRVHDRTTNTWKDGEALFMRCALWREAAENAAETLSKGARVIVTGKLRQRSYQTDAGENRTTLELQVEEVGPSLKYATAKITKTTRAGTKNGGSGPQQDDEPPF